MNRAVKRTIDILLFLSAAIVLIGAGTEFFNVASGTGSAVGAFSLTWLILVFRFCFILSCFICCVGLVAIGVSCARFCEAACLSKWNEIFALGARGACAGLPGMVPAIYPMGNCLSRFLYPFADLDCGCVCDCVSGKRRRYTGRLEANPGRARSYRSRFFRSPLRCKALQIIHSHSVGLRETACGITPRSLENPSTIFQKKILLRSFWIRAVYGWAGFHFSSRG